MEVCIAATIVKYVITVVTVTVVEWTDRQTDRGSKY